MRKTSRQTGGEVKSRVSIAVADAVVLALLLLPNGFCIHVWREVSRASVDFNTTGGLNAEFDAVKCLSF